MSAIKNAWQEMADEKGLELDEVTPKAFNKWLKNKVSLVTRLEKAIKNSTAKIYTNEADITEVQATLRGALSVKCESVSV